MDSAEECFLIRQQLREEDDDFDNEPLADAWGSYGGFQLVGHGKQPSIFCGKYVSLKGCLRTDLHKLRTLDGVNYAGKIFSRKVHNFCHNPSCPVCFKSGWAVREAGRIEARLAAASKGFGLVEHISCSVPLRDYGLSFEALRGKAVKALKVRGVVGGVMIFHGFRFRRLEEIRGGVRLPFGWYWSPHFHVLGFVLGGYARCRSCKRKWNCLAGCGGFDDRSYQDFLKDGFYVKVLAKRKTVFGTAWYQLNHASLKVGVKRFHVANWFGACSYRMLRVTVEYKKAVCPICLHDLVDIRYDGLRRFIVDKDAAGYERDTVEDAAENGRLVYSEVVKSSRWSSGSYDE
jgi:hypothetical protein